MSLQDNNLSFFTTYKRLETLRIKRNWTWDQLAGCLGVSRPRFFQVKTGKSNLSKKVLYRLAEAEAAAGIMPPAELAASFRDGKELTALLCHHDQELMKQLAKETRTLNGIMRQCRERQREIQDQLDEILKRQPDARFQKLLQPKKQLKLAE